jgi:TDG/mug DNA glycosylase family protein
VRTPPAPEYITRIPQNKFWRTLKEIGLLPTNFRPDEFESAVKHGIGCTDLCKKQAGRDHMIQPAHFDTEDFKKKIIAASPRAIAFTSKKAASVWFGRKTSQIRVGLQPEQENGFPRIFVLPSPSGAATGHWDIGPWRALADWLHGDRRS